MNLSSWPNTDQPRRTRRIALVGVLVLLGVVIAAVSAGVALGGEDAPTQDPATTAPSSPIQGDSGTALWPTNASGQTYGSLGQALDEGKSGTDKPDLVRAVATNGKVGYAYMTDLRGDLPTTPEERDAYNEANLKGREVPVYEADGVTQIGVFMIGGPGSELTVTRADGSTTVQTANPDGTITTTTTTADGDVSKTTE